jgi:hypothetical protein
MRVLPMLLLACTTATANQSCSSGLFPYDFTGPTGVSADAVGPSPGVLPAAGSATAGATHAGSYCGGWAAGWSRGWMDVMGPDRTPPPAGACPTPVCGSETYDDGYARGRTAGAQYAGRSG